MKNALGFSLCLIFYQILTAHSQSGFISIDCGAATPYKDSTTGISWVPDTNYTFGGSVANLSSTVTNSQPLQTLRYFTGTQSKYCFTLGPVTGSGRYLVRATFLYGSYDGASAYPSFGISVDASPWANITIVTATQLYFQEFIAVADSNSTSFVVCLLRGSTGSPFISTLELRPLTGAMYSLSYLGPSFLSTTARINFGAPTPDSVRYPDDPSDRIWVSDMVSNLQGTAPQTYSISTGNAVDVSKLAQDVPPVKVMQTAVVGGDGSLTYRLQLAGYPANSYAALYFAEIVNLSSGDVREFVFEININNTQFAGQTLDLARDAGNYTALEPSFLDVELPQLLDFSLVKTNVSNLNPLLNALEIYQILPLIPGTDPSDVAALSTLTAQLPAGESSGDPCLPVAWDFLSCSSDSPPRVTTIDLSGRNLTGSIPGAIGGMSGLINLWVDNNQLTGNIPDLSQLIGLQSLRVQNNQLSGSFPSSLDGLDNLTELNVANNNFTGTVPVSLLEKGGLVLQASGNPDLCANLTCQSQSKSGINVAAVVGGSVGGAVVIMFIVGALLCLLLPKYLLKRRGKKDPMEEGSNFPFQQSSSPDFGFRNDGDFAFDTLPVGEGVRLFHLPELVVATSNFTQMIGSGGYGPVYYGRAKDGQEMAVKVLSASSNQGAREFFNEVNLLSRVHHRNLVTLLGYCPDIKERMLIYEYMHRGSLRDYLHGPRSEDESIDWITRLNIVLDAAKGIEYLHTGCIPSIIHRDVKSSNILINSKFDGKVADFGLSKLTSEDFSAVSTTVRGTVGYLDPEYYVSQQLTTKSDVFSFGVVLLEIISGREPIIVSQPSTPDSNLVNWAKGLLQKGDVQSIVDPALGFNFRIESLWKVAELAFRSVEPQGRYRPTMGEIVLELTDIINLERQESIGEDSINSDSFRGFSLARTRSYDLSSIAPSGSLTDAYNEPILR